VIAVLDSLRISYHVTGGLASSFYGEPRLTQDIDFVVRVAPSEIARLSALLDREDAILSKLLWTMRGSTKSRDDVRGMLLDPTPVDERLLQRLADRLGCADLLREIRAEAKS
jgi:hypothetical protein